MPQKNIYLTGDIHGNPCERFSFSKHPTLWELTKDDIVFILGDFGLPWGIENPAREQSWKQEELYYLNWLSEKPWTTIALAGNHDDRCAISLMKEVDLFGGKARQFSTDGRTYNNIFYVDNPTAMKIDGIKYLLIPGARSHDIQDGILNPGDLRIAEWRHSGKMFRVRDYEWWDDEPVDIAATTELLWTLGEDYVPDYILTHEAPFDYIAKWDAMVQLSVQMEETNDEEKYLSELAEKYLNQGQTIWFHGHHHLDRGWTQDCRCIYHSILEIEGE